MSTTNETSLHIRWMIRRDVAGVLVIEGESRGLGWHESDFLRCLRQRNCIGMVAEENDSVIGHMIYQIDRGRLTIRNFAVAPHKQREGVGRRMMEKLVGKLRPNIRPLIGAMVPETLFSFQAFLKSCGFRCTSTHEGEFGDDAWYWFVYGPWSKS